MPDPCMICGKPADVGVGSGSYSYSVCEKHWAEIKRGVREVDYEALCGETILVDSDENPLDLSE